MHTCLPKPGLISGRPSSRYQDHTKISGCPPPKPMNHCFLSQWMAVSKTNVWIQWESISKINVWPFPHQCMSPPDNKRLSFPRSMDEHPRSMTVSKER